MRPDELTPLMAKFAAGLLHLKHLDAPTGISYLRHFVELRQHWMITVNPECDAQLRFVEHLPKPDYTVMLPITFCSPLTRAPVVTQLRVIVFFEKSRMSREFICGALLMAPMSRTERRRTLRKIRDGADLIHLEADAVDSAAVDQLLGSIVAAPPAA